ncbi:MAG: methyltransferase domain-containing protein [Oligoflexia bacterium]|nr:methyltransferase domain-containing protein [Oligoflexia bacterium]
MCTVDELDSIAKYHSSNSNGGFSEGWEKVNGRLKNERYSIIKNYGIAPNVLEVGFADGNITENLIHDFQQVVAIDGSKYYCDKLEDRLRCKNLKIVNDFYENYYTDDRFDTIILSHIIEHVNDPNHLLRWAKQHLGNEGRIIIITNSTNSLHRHMGTKLNILREPKDFTDYDRKLGHNVMFDFESLNEVIIKNDLNVIKKGGFYLKMLSNIQVEKQWSDEIIDASMSLGHDFPEIAAEIYFVVGKKQ